MLLFIRNDYYIYWLNSKSLSISTLSCPEATSLVGNLALHGRYMLASVAYLRDQIQRKPRILQLGMEVVKNSYRFNAWKCH